MKCLIGLLALLMMLNLSGEEILAVDSFGSARMPKNFRHTSQTPQIGSNSRGLRELQCIGSGAFTEEQIARVAGLARQPITVVDIRQENHVFLNGLPVSWYGDRNWGNLGLSSQAILEREGQLLQEASHLDRLYLHEILEKDADGSVFLTQIHSISIQHLLMEKEIVQKYDLGYFRLFVTDHQPPSDCEVDRFLTFYDGLPEDMVLYFHCRAGVGRTTTLMAMYDMLRNASTVGLSDIIQRQHELGGKDLFQIPANSYKTEYALKRAEFLCHFYAFAKQRDHGIQSWQEYKQLL